MSMDWDKEMQRAIELDGEKLRQLTGEDHGPFEPAVFFAPCPACFESCGYLGSHDTFSDGSDCFTPNPLRPCPECKGAGVVECEPVTLDDIENIASEEAGQ